MKTHYFILSALMIIAASLLTGCDYSRGKKVEDAKAEYEKEWQQFQKDAEFKIRSNENRINEFKTEIQTARGKFKAKYEKEVVRLEERNIELKKKISEYKYDGKEDWEEFKRGINHDLDVVGTALNDFFSKKD